MLGLYLGAENLNALLHLQKALFPTEPSPQPWGPSS